MTHREVEYRDRQGRKWRRGLPDGAPDSQAEFGIPLGPPPLTDLKLPRDLETRLHNQLYDRGLLTEADARARPRDLHGALLATFKVDTATLLGLYAGVGAVNGHKA